VPTDVTPVRPDREQFDELTSWIDATYPGSLSTRWLRRRRADK
jgi:hypothetical protein